SGKVRQAACRAAYLAGHLRRLGSRPGTAGQLDPVNVRDRLDGWPLPPLAGAGDGVAERVRGLVAAALDRPAGKVPLDQPLASLGLESLRAIELRRSVELALGVTVPMAELFPGTVAGLAGYLAERAGPGQRAGTDLVADPERRHKPFPLTELQQAYFVGRAHGFALGGVSIHFYAEFDSIDLDPDRLYRALVRLVHRQEMLRAVVSADGTQRIVPVADLPPLRMPVVDLSGMDRDERER